MYETKPPKRGSKGEEPFIYRSTLSKNEIVLEACWVLGNHNEHVSIGSSTALNANALTMPDGSDLILPS